MESPQQVVFVSAVQTLAIVIGIVIDGWRLKKLRAHMAGRFDRIEASWRASDDRHNVRSR